MSDNSHGLTECELETTEQRLANCVGFDRFGWFSEYNPGDTVSDFEQLLRRRLTYLYRLLNVESPKCFGATFGHGRVAPWRGSFS